MPQTAAGSGLERSAFTALYQWGQCPSLPLEQPQPRLQPRWPPGRPGQVYGCRVLTSELAPGWSRHSRALCPRPGERPEQPRPGTSRPPLGKTPPPPNYLTERKENSRPSRFGCFQPLNKTGLFQASPSSASFIFTLSHFKPLDWLRQAGIFFPGKVGFFSPLAGWGCWRLLFSRGFENSTTCLCLAEQIKGVIRGAGEVPDFCSPEVPPVLGVGGRREQLFQFFQQGAERRRSQDKEFLNAFWYSWPPISQS